MSIQQAPKLSVCTPTRNRPETLLRCINSLKHLKHILFEIIVLDDASEVPVADYLFDRVDPELVSRITLLRNETNAGATAARNRITQLAKAPFVLGIDDDAELPNSETIEAALKVLEADPNVGAIAFSQVRSNGELFPGQPAQHKYNCYVPWYIGYGRIIRRDLFIELGGYRENFGIFYEEPELCARMLDKGYYVVYLPDSGIIHHHSSIGRDGLKCLSNSYRNKCYAAIYNQPLPMMVVTIPLYILLYFWAHRKLYSSSKKQRERGVRWLIGELRDAAQSIYAERKALKWSTYYKLYKIKRERPKYQGVD